jgi:hypothetical protein
MSAIVPPLDYIPSLPGKGVTKVIQELNKQTDILLQQVTDTVKDSIKLPSNAKCDDPRVERIKKSLQEIQERITAVQETIPKIQTTVNAVKTVVTTANAIKAAITAAQLAVPATAGLFIAQQLMAIQDATIVNAIASLQQFEKIPDQLVSKISIVVPPLLAAIQKVSNTCNGDGIDALSVPELALDNVNWNDLVATKFYDEVNVSDEDLDDRALTIEELISQQRDLLTSLLEAPSQVFQQAGPPVPELGKAGDYYMDTENNTIYGPKLSLTEWGTGINY